LGDNTVGLIRSDGAKSFESATKILGVSWDTSEPEMHQNNGVIERFNHDVVAGTRTLLVQAGLPPVFWPFAIQCYCLMENVIGAPRADAPEGDMSRWEQRHGSSFRGTLTPFGAAVDYKPTPGRIDSSKAAPSTRYGVFMGYRMRTGSKWCGK